MSNVLKNIKSLFIVDETPTENQPQTNTTEQKQNTPVNQTPPPLPKTNTVPSSAMSGAAVLDQRIFDSLQKALEDSNQPGFDFLEFKNSLQTLATIIPDEATRYKSAYATAATMGLTVEKLLESAKFYQGILSREKENFDKAVVQQVDLNVTAKEKEVERLQTLIQQKAEQIKRLTEEITAHQEEMNKAQGIITEAASKIEATKSNFYFTLDAVMGQIQHDIANIERHLRS
jgi:competence CoiA-like predicted nuclease